MTRKPLALYPTHHAIWTRFQNMPTSNPFMPSSMNTNKPSPLFEESKDDAFDVDDIVKKIDAKIAQLEKEEEEAKKKEQEAEISMNQVINSPKMQVENNNNLQEIIGKKKVNLDETMVDLPVINPKKQVELDETIVVDNPKEPKKTVDIGETVIIPPSNNQKEFKTTIVNQDDFFDDFFDE